MIVLVDLKLIDDNPFQTRQSYPAEAIQELADNIASLRDARPDTLGLIHVPLARPVGAQGKPLASLDISACRFQLAAGHCRLRAFRLLAGQDRDLWWRMPLDVSELDDQAMADIAWSENQKRRDLTPIERARALSAALARFEWTQDAIGKRWGLSQSAVANSVRLLDLPEWAVEAIHQGDITERHGRALLGLLPLVPAVAPWPGRKILDRPAGGQRTAEELEEEVRLQVEQATRPLDKAPWWEAFQGWAPTDDVPGSLGSCQGCSFQATVLRRPRCTGVSCYQAKSAAYKREVAGPSRAKELHANLGPNAWERREVQSWTTCAGCGLTGRDVAGKWYAASGTTICPHCWLRADLPEPPKQKPAPSMRPVSPQAGASSPRPVPEMRPASPVSTSTERPSITAPVDHPNAPSSTVPDPVPAPTPAMLPAVLLSARIMPCYPGAPLADRRVMLSIAAEGRPPAGFKSGTCADLPDLVAELCSAYFGAEPSVRPSDDPDGPEEPETIYESEEED